jgi:hypothetical protein
MQVWTRSSEKFAHILVLNDHVLQKLKVTGNVLTLKRNLQQVLDALEQGQAPAEAGGTLVDTIDVRTVTRAEVSEANESLTLRGGEDNSDTLEFTTADDNADEVLRAILAQSGRTFQQTNEDISIVEALIPPAVLGAISGLFWAGVYQAANTLAAGERLKVRRIDRKGFQRVLVLVAERLGTNGTLVVGVILLVLFVGWAGMRIINRPQRTAWLPDGV